MPLIAVIPECLYQESKLPKGKKPLDSRLKRSGMTNEEDSRLNFGNDRKESPPKERVRVVKF